MTRNVQPAKDEDIFVQAADKAASAAAEAKDVAEKTRKKTWFHLLARLGYLVRGILYGLIGFMAVQLILFGRGDPAGRAGALEVIAQQPLGEPMLIVVAVGLVGMMLWSIVRAIVDTDDLGSGLRGTVARIGKVIYGLSYGVLLIPTFNMLVGIDRAGEESEQAQQAAAGVLGYSWGPWLVGAVGIVLIVIGSNIIRNGLQSNLDERLKTYKMTREQQKWALRSGRMGAVGHGIVMITIGVLTILAAWTLDPNKVGGMDGALLFLATQPYGPFILGVVAAGMLAYALYSILGAMWFRVED